MLASTKMLTALKNPNFLVSVGLGLVDGWFIVNKFFENPDVDILDVPVDLWSYGPTQGKKVFPAFGTEPVNKVVTNSALNLQQLAVYGIDKDLRPTPNPDNPNEPQYVTLTGLTPVDLEYPLYDCWRIQNKSSGAGKLDFQGSVYVYQDTPLLDGDPIDTTKVSGFVCDSGDINNQTLQCHFVVPIGYTACLFSSWAGLSREQTGVVELSWFSKYLDGVELIQNRLSSSSRGASLFNLSDGLPIGPIFGGTELRVVCTKTTDNNVGIAGGYKLLMVSNDKLS